MMPLTYIFVVLSLYYLSGLSLRISTTTEIVNDAPQEVQHAICKVYTKELEASAKATITRQLKGVCSSKESNAKFDVLHRELSEIRQMLIIISSKSKYKSPGLTSGISILDATTEIPIYDDYPDYIETEQNTKFNDILKEEIVTFNDSLVESSEGDLYFYYWNISDLSTLLYRNDMYISSPGFSVLGHILHLHFYPNYLKEYMAVLLKPDSNSFLKKHKISFIGRTDTKNQITSGILYGTKNEEKMFKIQSQMIDGNFIFEDSLLVKVKIYLNS